MGGDSQEEDEEEGGARLVVTIPEGVSAGELLLIEHNGCEVNVRAPSSELIAHSADARWRCCRRRLTAFAWPASL